jgi:polyisoprenoid-binding protein YceI
MTRLAAWLISMLASGACMADAPLWTLQDTSTLGFTATLQGAEFSGEFETFDAEIRFADSDLATSHFSVTVEIASVNTRNVDRDDALRGGDFFDAAHWPSAHFEAMQLRHVDGNDFEALGMLTIRDRTRALTLPFRFTRTQDAAKLAGNVTISRLNYGVGQGDWADTRWIGEDVTIAYRLDLARADPEGTRR